jgi:RNA polymerase sigma-70 factor, ECF subfamily
VAQETRLVPNFRKVETIAEEGGLVARTPDAVERETIRLFECHSDSLFRFLVRLLRDAELAADLTQECFLRLFRALAKEKIDAPRAWLFRVAHNLALNERKRYGRLRLVSVDGVREADLPHTNPVGVDIPRPESLDELNPALAALSRQERSCLELRAEGLRYRQIGEILGLEIPTVATFLARAIRKIGDYQNRKGRFL